MVVEYTFDKHRELQSLVNDLNNSHDALGHAEPAIARQGNDGCCSCGTAVVCRELRSFVGREYALLEKHL